MLSRYYPFVMTTFSGYLLANPEDIEDGQIIDVPAVREKLKPYTEKKRLNSNTIGFVPIEKVVISMEKPSYRLIYIKKCYVKETFHIIIRSFR